MFNLYVTDPPTSYSGHGDRKKAKNLLRVEPSSKTHDSNTFRSGLWLGLALPAIAAGCYLCENSILRPVIILTSLVAFDHYTRETFPTWSVLLFIYSVPLVPILMAVLIGVNILVWVRSRINYVFIFSALLLPCSVSSLIICTELDPRARLDHQEYFEVCAVWLPHTTRF